MLEQRSGALADPVAFAARVESEDARRSRCGLHQAQDFFVQAEDGIRDYKVTGVQTCALPIFRARSGSRRIESSSPLESAPEAPEPVRGVDADAHRVPFGLERPHHK